MKSSVPLSHNYISGAHTIQASRRCWGPWKHYVVWRGMCLLCSELNLGHQTINIPQMAVVTAVRVTKGAEDQHPALGFTNVGFLTTQSADFLHRVPSWASAPLSQNL